MIKPLNPYFPHNVDLGDAILKINELVEEVNRLRGIIEQGQVRGAKGTDAQPIQSHKGDK